MDADTERALMSGGDTMLHHHKSDSMPTHQTLRHLQKLANQVKISSDTILTYKEDLILVDTTTGNVTVTLPKFRGGNEATLVKLVAANQMIINTTGGDVINGAASITATAQWDKYHVKGCSDANGYVLL